MSTRAATLIDRHTDATQRLILDSAVELLEVGEVSELTVRAVARHAQMSERTVFRYFPSRDEFLDAVVNELVSRLHPPPPPAALDELLAYPAVLYARFEETAGLLKAILHADLYKRVRATVVGERWNAVQALIDQAAGHRSEHERRIAGANIHYYLSATTWHYFRFNFEFPPEMAVECATRAVRLAVADVTAR